MQQESSKSTADVYPDSVPPSEDKEWLVANGLGSYASLTIQNTNTRKFHGLLVASLSPPTRRWVLVSNIVEKMLFDNNEHFLNDHLKAFCYRILPVFIYQVEDTVVRKIIWMPHGHDTTMIRYEIESGDHDFRLLLSPLLNSRHFYDLTNADSVNFSPEERTNEICFTPSNIDIQIRMLLSYDEYSGNGGWNELYFNVDRERWEGWIDHAFRAGDILVSPVDDVIDIVFTTEQKSYDVTSELKNEIQHKEILLKKSGSSNDLSDLVLAADSFVTRRGDLDTILAGYHWFSDWGRDALIALPGATLITKRFDIARNILLNLASFEKDGLIPNSFIETTGEAIYNSVDAPLWLIDRAYQYVKYTNDMDFIRNIWDRLASIIEHYEKGTTFGIGMDEDYLISHGEGLTWMDVKIGDSFITPRARKAVEIQALWYNALRIMQSLAFRLEKENNYGELADEMKDSFQSLYDRQYDVIDIGDCSCRPNKIFLVSLDYSPATSKIRKEIVSDIQKNLLTPVGLRSLSRDDSRYYGGLIGDYHKDLAYHNGSVWPWLLGPFVTAFLKINKYGENSREYAKEEFLKNILNSIRKDGCIGSINELFDGNEPYLPRGCISQAWSVAEVLRTFAEDVNFIRPKFEKIMIMEDYIHDLY